MSIIGTAGVVCLVTGGCIAIRGGYLESRLRKYRVPGLSRWNYIRPFHLFEDLYTEQGASLVPRIWRLYLWSCALLLAGGVLFFLAEVVRMEPAG